MYAGKNIGTRGGGEALVNAHESCTHLDVREEALMLKKVAFT